MRGGLSVCPRGRERDRGDRSVRGEVGTERELHIRGHRSDAGHGDLRRCGVAVHGASAGDFEAGDRAAVEQSVRDRGLGGPHLAAAANVAVVIRNLIEPLVGDAERTGTVISASLLSLARAPLGMVPAGAGFTWLNASRKVSDGTSSAAAMSVTGLAAVDGIRVVAARKTTCTAVAVSPGPG